MIINDTRYQQSAVLPELSRNYVPDNLLADHCENAAHHFNDGVAHYVYDNDLVISETSTGSFYLRIGSIEQHYSTIDSAELALRGWLDSEYLLPVKYPQYPMVGLNADWSVQAWQVSEHVLLMDQEDGTVTIAVLVLNDGDSEQALLDHYNATPECFAMAPDDHHLLVDYFDGLTPDAARDMIAAADAVAWSCNAEVPADIANLITANAQAIHSSAAVFPTTTTDTTGE